MTRRLWSTRGETVVCGLATALLILCGIAHGQNLYVSNLDTNSVLQNQVSNDSGL